MHASTALGSDGRSLGQRWVNTIDLATISMTSHFRPRELSSSGPMVRGPRDLCRLAPHRPAEIVGREYRDRFGVQPGRDVAVQQARKVDVLKDLGPIYRPPGDPVLVEVPELRFLMLDGRGDPNHSEQYRAAVEALCAVSYAVKFAVKRGGIGLDYKVMPLEALWWSDPIQDFSVERKDQWLWTMMIMQPRFVPAPVVEQAAAEVSNKNGMPRANDARLETLSEGLCAQVMHVGPYSAEGPTVANLHRFIAEGGYALRGKHHEIYLGDPRRTAPERLRTVIRQPVAVQ